MKYAKSIISDNNQNYNGQNYIFYRQMYVLALN